jgi:pimeloyl-ACP methyl ester carboxylesterase
LTGSGRRNAVVAAALFLVPVSGPAVAKEPVRSTLDPELVKTGAVMTKAGCDAVPESLWITVEGKGDCILTYSAGLKPDGNSKAFLWFHGDRLTRRHARGEFFKTIEQVVIGYGDNSPVVLKRMMTRWSNEFRLPAIFVARPGTYGSSGDHSQRRQPREVMLIAATVEGLKRRHGIGKFIMAGQSGGGGVTAALLSRRTDIHCAVMTSGALAIRARVEHMKWPADATGAKTFYDPIDHVGAIKMRPDLRAFVVGDPRDRLVPFVTQRNYFEAIKARGIEAHLVIAQSTETKRFHALARLGMRMAGWCASGVASNEIVRRAQEPSK